MPFEMEVAFESASVLDRTQPLLGPVYDNELHTHRTNFETRFDKTFLLRTRGFQSDQIEFARSTLSNMIGSIGYFYGSSFVRSEHTRVPIEYCSLPSLHGRSLLAVSCGTKDFTNCSSVGGTNSWLATSLDIGSTCSTSRAGYPGSRFSARRRGRVFRQNSLFNSTSLPTLRRCFFLCDVLSTISSRVTSPAIVNILECSTLVCSPGTAGSTGLRLVHCRHLTDGAAETRLQSAN